jgi:histone deacetylase complex subunit SAP18
MNTYSADKRTDNLSSSQNYEVNREKICPFLLKVFYKENDFNSLEDLNNSIFPSSRELHIYTWMDASLREITMLVKEAVEAARKKDAVLNFCFVFPDSKGKLQRKEVGSVFSNKKGADDNKTLHYLKFSVGDYLDINISNRPLFGKEIN